MNWLRRRWLRWRQDRAIATAEYMLSAADDLLTDDRADFIADWATSASAYRWIPGDPVLSYTGPEREDRN